MVNVRPFREDDWPLLLDLADAAVPFAPEENRVWLAYRQAFDESRSLRRHFMAAEESLALGYGCLEQQGDDPSQLRVYVVCSPENLRGEVGSRLYDRVLQEARALEAAQLWAREFREDEPIRDFFMSRGFTADQPVALPDQRPIVVYRLDMTEISPH
jgi:N-acetylglutamate synthase-like GNAT family acetyltransferase